MFHCSCYAFGASKKLRWVLPKATCKKIRVHMVNNWDWQAKPLTLFES